MLLIANSFDVDNWTDAQLSLNFAFLEKLSFTLDLSMTHECQTKLGSNPKLEKQNFVLKRKDGKLQISTPNFMF